MEQPHRACTSTEQGRIARVGTDHRAEAGCKSYRIALNETQNGSVRGHAITTRSQLTGFGGFSAGVMAKSSNDSSRAGHVAADSRSLRIKKLVRSTLTCTMPCPWIRLGYVAVISYRTDARRKELAASHSSRPDASGNTKTGVSLGVNQQSAHKVCEGIQDVDAMSPDRANPCSAFWAS